MQPNGKGGETILFLHRIFGEARRNIHGDGNSNVGTCADCRQFRITVLNLFKYNPKLCTNRDYYRQCSHVKFGGVPKSRGYCNSLHTAEQRRNDDGRASRQAPIKRKCRVLRSEYFKVARNIPNSGRAKYYILFITLGYAGRLGGGFLYLAICQED